MKLIQQTLFLEFTDMVNAGFAERTLKHWDEPLKVADPADNRRKLFNYELLKPKYKTMVAEKFGDVYAFAGQATMEQFLTIDHAARRFYKEYRLPDGTGLPAKNIESYAQAADWLNLIQRFTSNEGKGMLKQLGLTKASCWEVACRLIESKRIELPCSYSRLLRKVNEFKATGYACLVSKKFGNNNSEKINEAGGQWLMAMYSLPIKMTISQLWLKYNLEASRNGWEPLKSEQTIYDFLHRDGNIQVWYAGRHGALAAKEKFGYSLKTVMPTFRDALWYSDGTGLNYIGQKDNKWLRQQTLYWIIDAYSEVILGYSVCEHENYTAQYEAAKMAVKRAGAKPYEWRYDNQGGHLKSETQGFMDKVAKHHFPTQPYNGKSKTIESLTFRFQNSIMRQDWFFSGQNRTAKRDGSKPNMEFILSHKKDLPTIQEITTLIGARIEEWNQSIHPKTGISRLDTYFQSQNPHHTPIDATDMVDVFWLTSKNALTYRTSGIVLEIRGEKYEYEVLADGMPDAAFRARWIGERFHVKYDPDDLSFVYLYLDTPAGLQWVAMAQPRIEVPRALVDHTPGTRKQINGLLELRKDEVKRMKQASEDVQQNTGVTTENLITNTAQYFKQESYNTDHALVPVSIYGREEEEEEFKDLD